MGDLLWLRHTMKIDPSYDLVLIFSERVGIILDGDNNPSKKRIEEARKQAFEEMRSYYFKKRQS
jgi:hypothetical protein